MMSKSMKICPIDKIMDLCVWDRILNSFAINPESLVIIHKYSFNKKLMKNNKLIFIDACYN